MRKNNKKILLVDDSLDILYIYSKGLKNAGFLVNVAENGQEGLTIALKEKLDLILLDILMPEMDGLTMARKLKDNNIEVPIILLTNIADANFISKALELGITDYIIKSDLGIDIIIQRIKQKLNLKTDFSKSELPK
jgi:two-component system alkaline phosphatase synthesis response regulator PhoP